MFEGMSRRDFLRITAAAAGGVGALTAMAGPVIDRAYAVDPCGTGSLDDIEHFVLLMQENRSFDHYYGTMSGVRGFRDAASTGTLEQRSRSEEGPHSPFQRPFRLDTTQGASLDGECINDPTHNWGPQHQCWNSGAMDQWVKVHIANEGAANGPATMGYYDARTTSRCTGRWPTRSRSATTTTARCSGPTDPNRLYWISGTLDPEGKHGGPLLDTPHHGADQQVLVAHVSRRTSKRPGCRGRSTPPRSRPVISAAVLSRHDSGVQAVQHQPDADRQGHHADVPDQLPARRRHQQRCRRSRGSSRRCSTASTRRCRRRSGASTLIAGARTSLTSNPAIWEKTALIISYDENGGFFDHVAPPTAAQGHAGRVRHRPDPLPQHGRGRHRPDRSRVPGAGPGDLAVLPRRPRRVRGLRPHLAAAADRASASASTSPTSPRGARRRSAT